MKNKERRILVVDDDPESQKIVSKALQWEGYHVDQASSGEEAIGKIQSWRPHLVLLDVNMPGLNGLDTLKTLRLFPEYVSTIFLSGQSKTEDIIIGLDAGADDYITKPFDPQTLLARVRTHLRIKDLRDDLRLANAKLKDLVDIDDLTGLFNMRSLYKKLDHELQRAKRYGRSVCVLMMDMDHFKTVNDGHDHLFGSFVLSEVGGIIKSNIRNVDFAARYGGDEFLIVLTEIDFQGASIFADRLRQTIEDFDFSNDEHSMRLTASLGFAITPPGSGDIDARSLVRNADRMLYESKESGRNCVTGYDFSEKNIDSKNSIRVKKIPQKISKIS